ncbi:MAG: septal ring lytic transglycosylase RlpA family protein [Cytophagales bacterium]|nr:septal ring lytic transglycosylase RlpA family protein [Cytophagales bacterium]
MNGFAQVREIGTASYYANKLHGMKTASGELYHKDSLTAAHRSFAFGTKVKVTRLKNGRSVIVRINDRGPFVEDRILDLSEMAMKILDGLHDGIIEVKMQKLGFD